VNPRDWKPNQRAEREYGADVWQLFLKFFEESKRHGIAAHLLSASEFLRKYAEQAALRMITGLYWKGARTWREAARLSGKTGVIYRALQQEMSGAVGQRVRELVREQATLISTFPESVAEAVATRAMAQQQAGGRSAELARYDGLLLRVAHSRALLIARTQVSKASTALTRARSESLSLPWYIWRGSLDQRERASHRRMEDVLIRFDTPPSPEMLIGLKSQGHYNAGEIYSCRCYPETLVRYDQVSWPHEAYYAGKIQRMTLAQFKRLNQFQQEAA
jgi:hypothetical protein